MDRSLLVRTTYNNPVRFEPWHFDWVILCGAVVWNTNFRDFLELFSPWWLLWRKHFGEGLRVYYIWSISQFTSRCPLAPNDLFFFSEKEFENRNSASMPRNTKVYTTNIRSYCFVLLLCKLNTRLINWSYQIFIHFLIGSYIMALEGHLKVDKNEQ